MAPEVLQAGSLSMAADVYSFAMLMLELWTGEILYKDFPAHQVSCKVHAACVLISDPPYNPPNEIHPSQGVARGGLLAARGSP